MENTVLKALRERRSIRSYKEQQITQQELDLVLEAGTYAPTGMGTQSPRIIAVQDKAVIAKLSEMNAKVLGSKGDPFYGAPTAVAVLFDSENYNGFADGCLVMGNMMNAAHALGLGSCWINRAKQMFDDPEGRSMLRAWGIEDRYRGVGICILGYPDCPHPDAPPRKADYILKV